MGESATCSNMVEQDLPNWPVGKVVASLLIPSFGSHRNSQCTETHA